MKNAVTGVILSLALLATPAFAAVFPAFPMSFWYKSSGAVYTSHPGSGIKRQ